MFRGARNDVSIKLMISYEFWRMKRHFTMKSHTHTPLEMPCIDFIDQPDCWHSTFSARMHTECSSGASNNIKLINSISFVSFRFWKCMQMEKKFQWFCVKFPNEISRLQSQKHICKYSKCVCTSVKCNTFSISIRPPVLRETWNQNKESVLHLVRQHGIRHSSIKFCRFLLRSFHCRCTAPHQPTSSTSKS